VSLAALAGDAVAARIIAAAGRALGRALADVCNCLNPEAIVVGGVLATAGVSLIEGIRESIARYAQPAHATAVTVCASELGPRSEVIGAVAVAARGAHVSWVS
jgi:predicted NBD/HSP70 family sugar kinase